MRGNRIAARWFPAWVVCARRAFRIRVATRENGGYRYLYLYLEKRAHFHLLLQLDKNEQEDASEEQRKLMRE